MIAHPPKAYYVGVRQPMRDLFQPVKNAMPYSGLPKKPEGGLWMSPWSSYAPAWVEFLLDSGLRFKDWDRLGVWEVDVSGLKTARVAPTDPYPDFEELAREYDLFFLMARDVCGWTYTWDIPTFVLLRWVDGLEFRKIADSVKQFKDRR